MNPPDGFPPALRATAREIATLLREAPRVLLCTHVNPDGDTLGSMMAVGLALRGISHGHVTMMSPGPIAPVYGYLPSLAEVVTTLPAGATYDVAAVFDCDQLSRVGEELMTTLACCPVVIDVDHHPSPSFGTHTLHDISASATGELSALVIEELGVRVTPEIATCLLTAVMTDTSRFLFPNTTPRALRLAAAWREAGGAYETISELLFARRSWPTTQLLARVLAGTTLHDDGAVAIASLRHADFADTGGADADSEGLVNYLGDIEGVRLAALLREVAPGEVRVSFRSRSDLSVRPAAVRFGGGGHERAAGCTIAGNLDDACAAVREALRDVMRDEVRA